MNKHQKDLYTICSTNRSPNGTLAYIGTSITFKAGIITFVNVLNKKDMTQKIISIVKK